MCLLDEASQNRLRKMLYSLQLGEAKCAHALPASDLHSRISKA